MDYIKLIDEMEKLLETFDKIPYGKAIGATWPYNNTSGMVWNSPEPYFIDRAITAISELVVENQALRCNANRFKSSAKAAEDRAEKAERERDAAISDMEALIWHSGDGCQICAHAREVHKEPYVRLECDLREKGKPLDCEPKWRGIKEE